MFEVEERMEEIYLLCEQPKKATAIYTQNSGGSPNYQDLSQVCRARLVAMYNLYLEYLLGELIAKDPDAAALIATNQRDTVEEDVLT